MTSYCIICKAECKDQEIAGLFYTAAMYGARYITCKAELEMVRLNAIKRIKEKDVIIQGLVDNPDYLHEQIDTLKPL